jgi:hypothetical protein
MEMEIANLNENKIQNVEYDMIMHENKFLKQINSDLLAKVDELTTRLHKYTNGDNHKRYYEKNKDKIKQSGALYLQKLKSENPEKIKAYSKRAYANKKKKMNDASNNQPFEPNTPSQPFEPNTPPQPVV